MVINDSTFPTPVAAANLLHLDGNTYYATGSRWMGGWKPESDWDYMTEDTPEVVTHLIKQGFVSKRGFKQYGDGSTRDVLEHKCEAGIVQVQLCVRVDLKYQVACYIRDNHFEAHLKMSADQRTELWHREYLQRRYPAYSAV